MNDYGRCENCAMKLYPVWFIEEERDEHMIKTGRRRRAVSHLVCPNCFKNYAVDDLSDGKWK